MLSYEDLRDWCKAIGQHPGRTGMALLLLAVLVGVFTFAQAFIGEKGRQFAETIYVYPRRGAGDDPKGDYGPNSIELDLGRSVIINAPWPIRQVSIADPNTADIQALSPTQVVLMGKMLGTTDLILRSGDGDLWQAAVKIKVPLHGS